MELAAELRVTRIGGTLVQVVAATERVAVLDDVGQEKQVTAEIEVLGVEVGEAGLAEERRSRIQQ